MGGLDSVNILEWRGGNTYEEEEGSMLLGEMETFCLRQQKVGPCLFDELNLPDNIPTLWSRR